MSNQGPDSQQKLAGENFPETVYETAEAEVRKDRIADEHFNVRLNKARDHELHMQGAPEENRAIYAAAEHWARIMQYEMRLNRKKVADVADDALGELRPDERTVLNQMVGHLTRYWQHGQELKLWYQEHKKKNRSEAVDTPIDNGPLARVNVAEAAQRWKRVLEPLIEVSKQNGLTPDLESSIDRALEADIKTYFYEKPHLRIPQVALHLAREWPEAAEALKNWSERKAIRIEGQRVSWAKDVNTRLTPPDDERSL